MKPDFIVFIFLLICSAQNALASLATKSTRWEKPNIIVCWANWNEIHDHDWNSKASLIKETIEKEFNTRSPVTFSGWEPCADVRIADAVISFDFRTSSDSNSHASLGRGEYPDHNGLYSYVYLDGKKESTLQEMLELKQTAIHEFGHLAGLMHEHIRVEAKNDPNCIESRHYNLGVGSEKTKENISVLKMGEYDPHSIMNYCFNEKVLRDGLQISLSAGDIRTLQELYKK